MPALRPSALPRLAAAGALALLLAACSTVERGSSPALERQATWVVLPFANHTETPLAGQRAETMAGALLHASGVGSVRKVPAGNARDDALFTTDDETRAQEALAWARENRLRYALAGAVEEWRYKVGVDGEPAAGVTLQILDVTTGDVLWSGTGGQSGWSREALSAVAQKLMSKLLSTGLANAR